MKPSQIDIDSFWLPHASSTGAAAVDLAFYAVYGVSVVAFVLVAGLAVLFAVRYRRRAGPDTAREATDHHTGLEITWTAVPVVVVLGLFALGLLGFIDQAVPPGEALEVQVTAERYLWSFTYPDGTRTVNELTVPVGRPVRLLMSSKDVLHSFFVPEFRVKQDIVPGRYTGMWFEPTRVMETTVLCTEYCGVGHSGMLAKVVVLEQKDFDRWLETGGGKPDLPPAELGRSLFSSLGCATCHSLDGTRIQGPSLKGVFGRQEALEGGGQVTVDENYLRESILYPQKKIVAGYPPVMPTFQGLVKDSQLDALIAFLKAAR